MKQSGLVVMFLLLMAAFAAVFYLRGQEDEAPPVDPLRNVDFSTLKAVVCRDGKGSEWRLEIEADKYFLRSSQIADGLRVSADQELARRVISLLKESRPVRDLDLESIDPKAWGLQPPSLILALEDGSKEHLIHVSRPDLDNGVLYYRPGEKDLFRVNRRIFDEFRRAPYAFRNPRLSSLSYAEVQGLQIKRPHESVSMRRLGGRWFLSQKDRFDRANPLKVDQLVAFFANQKGGPLSKERQALDWQELAEVSLNDGLGKIARYFVYKTSSNARILAARRADETELRQLPLTVLNHITITAEQLRDPSLIGLAESELASIIIEGPGRKLPLLLRQREGKYWYVGQGRVVPRVDRSRFEAFRDRVLNLRIVERLETTPDFDAFLTIRLKYAGDRDRPDLVVKLSRPRDDGLVLAQRSDEKNGVLVAKSELEALQTPYWKLMQLHVFSASDAAINHFTIDDQKGRAFKLERSDDGVAWQRSQGEPLGASLMTPVLSRLAYLGVADFLGVLPADQVKKLFAKPSWKVSWHSPEQKNEKGIPYRPETKIWEIGGLVDDIHHACRINLFPGLIFSIKGEDLLFLNVLFNALRGA
ncbi:MAG: DUF4340 domain-containing protein [Planctomycetota bacterium]